MECRRHRTGPDSDEIPRRGRTGLVRDNQTDLDCGTGRPGERSRAVTHPCSSMSLKVLETSELSRQRSSNPSLVVPAIYLCLVIDVAGYCSHEMASSSQIPPLNFHRRNLEGQLSDQHVTSSEVIAAPSKLRRLDWRCYRPFSVREQRLREGQRQHRERVVRG